jgi:hypothetical protein
MVLLKAVVFALVPQILHLIVFGELVIHFEPDLVSSTCPGASSWVDIVRCEGLKDYSGTARVSSGAVVLAQLALCVVVSSAGFVHRFQPVLEQPPWKRNHAWLGCVFVAIGLIAAYVAAATEDGTAAALPWYYYLIAAVTPFLCLLWVEICKLSEARLEIRAEKLRRLQFETRLGAWSPR